MKSILKTNFEFFFKDLHFKLATRKSSGQLNSRPSSGNKFINKNEVNLFKSDPREQKGFEKLIREASKETDLNKRLNDIKINYDQNKYEILVTKLKDAESKNEYLTNIINQLQTRRSVNSAYRYYFGHWDLFSRRHFFLVNLM